MTATSPPAEPATPPPPAAHHLLTIQTPFGRPVGWAEAAVVTDIGDSHELNDDRCLVLTSTDLGGRGVGSSDFMLCLLADGATGSMFRARAAARHSTEWRKQAGWRASQLAQSVFVQRFLTSPEVDALDRLKDGLRAADRALSESSEGTLSSTLVALYLAADGTAYAASIGDSTLLVRPPRRKTPGDRRLKKLGYEDSTAVGSGETTLSGGHENECIEYWWPHKEDGAASTRVTPGTVMVLLSDGIADNLPAEFIDQMVHGYPLDRATVGLPVHTRERRMATQQRTGGSTQQLGLDNMSAIVVRFDGPPGMPRAVPVAPARDDSLITLVGTHGGPTPDAGGQFGLACVGGDSALVAGALAQLIESEHHAKDGDRLAAAFGAAASPAPSGEQPRLAVLAVDARGNRHAFSSGGANLDPGSDVPVTLVERLVAAARETPLQRLIRTPTLWGPALAALAIFVVVSTAFATGTVRPAPPPAPTARPGELPSAADGRPSLSIGGFVLQQPVQPRAVPLAPPAEAQDKQAGDQAPDSSQPAIADDASVQAGADEVAEPAAPPCGNFFGIGCPPPPAPQGPPVPPARSARPAAPAAPTAPNGVVPVPSPAALPDESLDDLAAATSAPPRGSRLESALQEANAADANFAREVDPTAR